MLYIFWNLIDFNDGTVLVRKNIIDDFALVIVKYGAL